MFKLSEITPEEIKQFAQEAGVVPIFVYGSLRVGQWNYDWCEDAVEEAEMGLITKGKIYWVVEHDGYPVADLTQDGTIIGDVLWFDSQSPLYHRVVKMEEGAGYEMRMIAVEGMKWPSPFCVSFHYTRFPAGELIPSGDWVSAYQKR